MIQVEQAEMESIKHKSQSQNIINFYQKKITEKAKLMVSFFSKLKFPQTVGLLCHSLTQPREVICSADAGPGA